MIPFYIYYSMFGFQRIGDLAWAAGDMRARGFLIGGTSGRTTLNGEGLQHEDGHSHILSATIPNCVSYDPTFSYEVAVIVQDGLRRMIDEQEDVFYYLTLLNENYPHPAMPAGAEEGIVKGMYLFKAADTEAKGHRVQLMGCGAILREVIAGAELLEKDFGIAADIWSVTSFTELAPRGAGRASAGTCSTRSSSRACPISRPARQPRRGAGHRLDRLHEAVRRADPALCRPQHLPRPRHRRLRPLRLSPQTAQPLRGRPPLRRRVRPQSTS